MTQSTDFQVLINCDHRNNDGAGPDAEVHLDLAIQICKALYRHEDSEQGFLGR